MGKENDIQWHLGFCAAMELELREYADKLEFHREYPLSRKPLLIDLLVVEKSDDFEISNAAGADRVVAYLWYMDNIEPKIEAINLKAQ